MNEKFQLAEDNKQRVRDFFEVMNKGDVPALLAFYADDGFVWTSGNTLISGKSDKAKIADSAGGIFDVFPEGLVFTLDSMVAEGEKVAVEAHSKGLHVSGQIYSNLYHFLFEFKNGKLVSLKEYMDTERVTDVLCGGVRPSSP